MAEQNTRNSKKSSASASGSPGSTATAKVNAIGETAGSANSSNENAGSTGLTSASSDSANSGGVKTGRVSSGSVKTGATFKPVFVARDEDPYSQVKWTRRTSQITGADGKVVFAMDNAEVPESWSQLATDIVVSKYFRKAGVPKTGHETSVRQLVHRVAHSIRAAGENFKGYFATAEDAVQFENELVHILLNQKGAFNSPVWFNCGLWHEYGIQGSGGSWAWNSGTSDESGAKTGSGANANSGAKTGSGAGKDVPGNFATDTLYRQPFVEEIANAYARPQCSACFIQSVDDDLMSIFDLVKNEARIFKYGSGTGTNFSKIRGANEKLSGGGTSSGLMSFLEVLDRGAGATKSGGTTRRAAKMVSLDMDHPEIQEFINWKLNEEKKVAALVAGGYSSDFNGDAYKTVAGQNSNNSVRINDDFMSAVERDGEWKTTNRTDGSTFKTYRARELWEEIAVAAWSCADPGVQFDTTIQKWHTCPDTDRINGSNPCSEYMFLDDSACNLASLNLVKFLKEDGSFDLASYRHACRVLFTAQEILVDFSSYPTARIAQNSHDFRPLGLGYANLGTLLMIKGIPYDSERALAWTGALTSIMHGEAYRTSSEMAASLGPFAGYAKNSQAMMRVMKQHQRKVNGIDSTEIPRDMMQACHDVWRETIALGSQHGFRNAQSTVLAPTGTIGLLMDCDTTGIEPDFALVKFKKLSGGGFFKIVNQSVPKALKNLGYTEKQIGEIVEYAVGTMSLEKSPHIHRESLMKRGLNEVDLQKISSALPGAFDLDSAISAWVIGSEGLARAGFTAETLGGRQLLDAMGFNRAQVREASKILCGRMMLEGAPHLKLNHLAVFDCANKCGIDGTRFIEPMAHIRMMASAQAFLSGAISKTVNLPHEASVKDIENVYLEAWKLGVKAVAVYRDGSKMSQPLSGKSTSKADDAAATAYAELNEASQSSGEPSNDSAGESAGELTDQAESRSAIQAESSGLVERAVLQAVSRATTNSAGDKILYSQKDLEDAIARAVSVAPARKRKMPQRRNGITVESRVGGHQIFLRTGEYHDGRLGEIFIDMHKEGATLRSLLNCFAISISIGLQYGVPLEDYVDKFTFTRFEPHGLVDHPNIKTATSLLDYIFRVVGMEYLGKTDFVHVKPALEELAVNSRGEHGAMAQAENAARAHVETALRQQTADESARTGGQGTATRELRAQLDLPLERAMAPSESETVTSIVRANTEASQTKSLSEQTQAAVKFRSIQDSAGENNSGGGLGSHSDALNSQLSNLMGDAPMCATCGHVTVRNGSCYRCLNCGNSMGCS